MTVHQQNALAEQCLPMAYALARRWWRLHGGSLPDLRGEAFLAVVRASRAFDPARGSFGTLAYRYVVVALCHGAKLARRRLPTCSLAGFDPAGPADAEPVAAELPTYLATALDTLTPRQRRVVVRVAVEGARVVDVAAEAGVRWCTIHKSYRGTLARLASVVGARQEVLGTG